MSEMSLAELLFFVLVCPGVGLLAYSLFVDKD